MTRRPERLEDAPQLADAVGVGPPASADVDGVADLQDVAAVEGARRGDVVHRQPELVDHLLGGDDLASPALGAGPGDHREAVEEHDGVLDEHRVRAVVGGWDLEEVPPGRLERTDVLEPLAFGELLVDRHPLDVGDQPVCQPGTGPADEGGAHRAHRASTSSGTSMGSSTCPRRSRRALRKAYTGMPRSRRSIAW